MIYTFVQYTLDKNNKGDHCNKCLDLVGDDDWVLFIDSDMIFTTNNWLKQCYQAIEENPEVKMFSGVTNRTGCNLQKAEVDESTDDLAYHFKKGEEIYKSKSGVKLFDPNSFWRVSAFMLLIEKRAWEKAGKFRNGHQGTDNDIHQKFINHHIPVGIITNLYVYHRRIR